MELAETKKDSDCTIFDLGTIDYLEAYYLQKSLHNKRQSGKINDALLILEHLPVVTLGRRARQENMIADRDFLCKEKINVFKVDRGGDITVHAPGQLVVYPIFSIKNWGLHLFLTKLEAVILEFLSRFGISGQREKGLIGIWVGNNKIGFIGVGISKWVSFHGVSININCDLKYFSYIIPCGIKCQVTSLSQILGKKINFALAKDCIISAFSKVFNLDNVIRRDSTQT